MFQQFKTKLAEQKVDSPKETAEFKKLSPAEKMAVKDIYIMTVSYTHLRAHETG